MLQVIKVLETAAKASTASFSPSGEHLAVGLANGGLQVFEFHPTLQQVHWSMAATAYISVLAFSPDGKWLAAGSHDQYDSLLSSANLPILVH
jgi:WD40 repeat protein